MRIHTNTLTRSQVRDAANSAGVTIIGISEHGSRSRARAYDVGLSGSGRHGGQYGNTEHKSATWDEWGFFLAALFTIDESVTIPRVYESRKAFEWVTGNRYDDADAITPHIQHKWTHDRSATGTYYVQTCKCGAIVRRPAYGYTLADIIG